MADYYVIPTNIGEAKMANALALGVPLAITELAIGDGEGDGARGTPLPNPAATTLVSERRRAPVNSFAVDPDNANVLMAEQVVPETVGGWWIREMGLFDSDGDMIFVCNTPPTYKPQLAEGSGRTQVVRMAAIVSDTSAVTLKVDPAVVVATRSFAQDLVSVHEESRNHPAATEDAQGMIQLATDADTVEGERPDRAAHPRGVRASIVSEISNRQPPFPRPTVARKRLVTHLDGAFIDASVGGSHITVSEKELHLSGNADATFSFNFEMTRAVSVTENYIDFCWHESEPESVNYVEFYLYPDYLNDPDSYFRKYEQNREGYLYQSELRARRSHKKAFAVVGNPTWNFTENARIKYVVNFTKASKVIIYNGIVAAEPPVPVLLNSDDADLNIYTKMFPVCKKYGVPNTFYVQPSWVGSGPDFVTWEQLRELQAAGWTIANHGGEHTDMTTITIDEAINLVESGMAELADRGFRGAWYFAAPFNSMTDAISARIRHAVRSLRTGATGLDGDGIVLSGLGADYGAKSVKNTDTVQGLIDIYLDNKAQGMGFAFNFHGIVDADPLEYEFTAADFEEFVDRMVNEQNAYFITAEELFRFKLDSQLISIVEDGYT